MTYRGKVQGGTIVLENGADLPEGALVRIELLPGEELAPGSATDPLLEMTSLAVETWIPDLATNVDHYLCGKPKSGEA
jgi:hypothetical protein